MNRQFGHRAQSPSVLPNLKVDSALHAKLKQPPLWGWGNLKGCGPLKFRSDRRIISLHIIGF